MYFSVSLGIKEGGVKMEINPVLKDMGFSATDKVMVIHADDVGITQSSIDAFQELLEFGTISSGSAMVPAPWFPEAAKLFRENPDIDLGLHFVLNCEYESYRWRPVSTMSKESGFVDENGYFKQDKQEVSQTANPSFVTEEIDAQLQVARNLGMKPTHVDTHCGILWAPDYMDAYANFYKKHGILPVLFNIDPDNIDPAIQGAIQAFNMSTEKIAAFAEQKLPMVDSITGLPVEHTHDVDDRLQLAKQILDNVKPGKLTHFAFHPLKDTPESHGLQRYSGGRIGDYEVFMRKELKNHLKEKGIQLVGYKDIIRYM